MKNKKKINIIYIAPANKNPSGGSKVIYQHSELINKFKIDNMSSYVLHLKKTKISKILLSLKKRMFSKPSKKYGWHGNEMRTAKFFVPSPSWTKHKIQIKNDMNFNAKTDFVILPEIWAHFANNFLIKNKIKYSIFVQGVYHMNSFYDHKKLFESYKRSEFIITPSEDTHRFLKKFFQTKKIKF